MNINGPESISCNSILLKLKKNVSQAMGMTLRKDSQGRCIVARIMIGGLIHRHGGLHVGDEIVEINSESVIGDSLEFIQRLLKTAHGIVYITAIPNYWRDPQNCEIYVRAMFDYEPSEDPMLPASQMGLSFMVGDILRIISKDDNSWWQAQHLDSDVDSPARLIPSCEMQERRAVSVLAINAPESYSSSNHNQNHRTNALHNSSPTASSSCNPFFLRQKLRQSRSTKVITPKNNVNKHPITCNGTSRSTHDLKHPRLYPNSHINNNQNTASNTSHKNPSKISDQLHLYMSDLEFSPYEEVLEIAEHPRRSLILLGAHGVGRRHIKNWLVQTYPHMFAAPVPHTSQAPLPNQINGKDYYFASQEEMLSDIANNQYLEYGRQEDILYGIKLETVRCIVACKLIPVLDVEPQTLRLLRNGEFSPFVVFVSPPDLEMMSESAREISDIRLERLAEESELLESVYRPYIDMDIVNFTLEDTVEPIVEALNELHSNPQWIPVTWVY